MGKTSDLTAVKMAEVKVLLDKKIHSNREIARKLNISPASVRRIKMKIDSGEQLISQRKNKCGRKPIFNQRSERRLKIICLENRYSSVKEIKNRLENTNILVSERTIRRKLSEMSLKAYKPMYNAKLLKLSDNVKVTRIKIGKDSLNPDLDFPKLDAERALML